VILNRKAELLEAIDLNRKEKKLDMLFLAVVNIVSLESTLLAKEPSERSLARAAFPPGVNGAGPTEDESLYYLGGLVSRKNDFVPALSRAINKNGWSP
jgi:inorganic pyrophosphatase/exopolyphosphatase